MNENFRAKRILIATIGSLGDLHPCLALALELKRRGHRVTIAATEFYRSRVLVLGIGFCAMRPNWDPADQTLIRACEDLKRGPEVLFRRFVLPELRGTYDDLAAAAKEADLLIAGELVFAAPLVAEKLGLPWVSAILSPCSFFSAHDPSVLVTVPGLIHLRRAGWRVYRAALHLCLAATHAWWEPVRLLRRDLGLRTDSDPFKDKFSPDLVLALFSHTLAEAQKDWPAQTEQPGFVFFEGQAAGQQPAWGELANFLASGEPPIVFTQGSTAVHNPGNFYEAGVKAARLVGRRALLLGFEGSTGSPEVMAARYAPYSQVFPHAAVIVHQGGSGTTGAALRAARPMLIVPYGWDQPDNGARVERMGAGLCVARSAYTAKRAAAALERLLGEPAFAAEAAKASFRVGREGGAGGACDAIERVLRHLKNR